eukprot:3560103-Amphidinium_carterae.1
MLLHSTSSLALRSVDKFTDLGSGRGHTAPPLVGHVDVCADVTSGDWFLLAGRPAVPVHRRQGVLWCRASPGPLDE